MKRILFLSFFCLFTGLTSAGAQIQKFLVNKYWQYNNSIYREDKKHIYNFKSLVTKDSIKEIAMYFDKNGSFKEVVNKNHPKPARTGTWHIKGDTVVIDFAGQSKNPRWYYKIHYIDAKEFQCSMSN